MEAVMSDMTDAFDQLRAAYQGAAGATPLLTFGAEEVQILPGEVPIDMQFVGGGTADAGQITVMCLASDFTTEPDDEDLVQLSDHPNASDGTYQVISKTHREGTVYLVLGNNDV
jgi:hypothetical protein